jgi:hypothetical protein
MLDDVEGAAGANGFQAMPTARGGRTRYLGTVFPLAYSTNGCEARARIDHKVLISTDEQIPR